MKKKKIKRLIIAVILVIVILIVITKMLNKNNTNANNLASLYNQLTETQSYLFEMERNAKNKVIIAKKDNKTMIDQYSEYSHLTILAEGDKTYLVLHDKEEYLVYGQDNVEQNILADGIKELIDKPYTTGTEKIHGKKYFYEEYLGSTIFTISNTLDTSDEGIKTRFFFDKNDNLVYIKTMTANDQELLKIKVKKQVDDSVFEIPSNYAES
ncbi:MAG: hypothetical protein IJE59_02570 [Clostridia bacterium]|nr:hypothetical protein [Clostridia bacterium]